MTLDEINIHIKWLKKEGFEQDNNSFARYPLFLKKYIENEKILYEVEIALDPKIINVYMPTSSDNLELKIRLNYKEPVLLPDVIQNIRDLYNKINPKVTNTSFCSDTYGF